MTPFNVLIMKKLFVEVQSLFSKWDTGIFTFVNFMLVMIKKEEVQLAIEKHLSINYSDEEYIKKGGVESEEEDSDLDENDI